MPKAGFCKECNKNVWLGEDGSCENGHSASSISNVYETEQIKVSMSQAIDGLVEVLFECVGSTKNSKELRDIANEAELITFNLFAVDFITQTTLKDPVPFLDAFHSKLCETLEEPRVEKIKALLEVRFLEYERALKTKESPNYIWSIGKEICKNVLGREKAKDIMYVMHGSYIWHETVITYKKYFTNMKIEAV